MPRQTFKLPYAAREQTGKLVEQITMWEDNHMMYVNKKNIQVNLEISMWLG